MRHQEVRNRQAFEVVEAPAVAEAAKVAQQATPAAPDVPKAAGVFMILAYATLMAGFALTIHGGRSAFAIAIGAFYVAMFFGVPAVFLGIERDGTARPDLGRFLVRGMDTATGPISGGGALVQMLLVPALLALGVFAMGITYLMS